MNLYAGNLPFGITENELKELFEPFGQVTEVRLIMDKFTGQSKGFAFIEMPSKDDAQRAITELNGRDMNGRTIAVNEAKPKKEQRGRTGFGRGGSKRGGRGGSRGGNRGGGYGRRDRY